MRKEDVIEILSGLAAALVFCVAMYQFLILTPDDGEVGGEQIEMIYKGE